MHPNKTAIVIINWNSWADSCECLSSLFKSTYRDFMVVCIDNGSSDDSMVNMSAYANKMLSPSAFIQNSLDTLGQDSLTTEGGLPMLLLISSSQNLGFAKASNAGIYYALQKRFKYIMLLNNDTIIEPGCLTALTGFLETHLNYGIVTPKIYYYHNPERIWCFGGRINFAGLVRYNYGDQREDPGHVMEKDITFVSGCALLARREIFEKWGMLTEKFFFGEEDYEFSMRMKKNRIKMKAIAAAKVYHKIGASNNTLFKQDELPKMYIGYLNRFIDRKNHFQNRLVWKIWRFFYLLYIIPKLTFFYQFAPRRIFKMTKLLLRNSNDRDEVDREMFYKAKGLLL